MNFRNKKKPARFLPQLEMLEDRWCPATASIGISQGLIAITGNGQANTIIVKDNGQGHVSAVIKDASGDVLASGSGSGISKIDINGAGGNDTIDYSLTGQLSVAEILKLDLGGGNVNADLDFSQGVASSLSVNVFDGWLGNDTLQTNFGALTGSAAVNFQENLGQGTSVSTVNFSAIAAGTSAYVGLDGNVGHNTANVNFAGAVSGNVGLNVQLGGGSTGATVDFTGGIDSGAKVSADIYGDKGSNQIAIDFGAAAGAKIDLSEYLGAGTTSSNVTFGSLSGGSVNLGVDGGAGSHVIEFTFASITGTHVNNTAWFGSGTDSYTLNLDGAITGNAHVAFALHSTNSNADIAVNALSTNVDAGSSLTIWLGGFLTGSKDFSVNYDGAVNGYLGIFGFAGANAATFDDNVDVTGGSGTVIAHETGSPAADSLTLDVTGTTSGLSLLNAVIFANPGNSVFHTPNVVVKAH